MNDLCGTLRYMTAADHKRYGLERSDPSDTSPGWFVEAYENKGYDRILTLTRVTNEQALVIANALDLAVGEHKRARVRAAVARQNAQHIQERDRRKAFLENQLVETQRELERIVAER